MKIEAIYSQYTSAPPVRVTIVAILANSQPYAQPQAVAVERPYKREPFFFVDDLRKFSPIDSIFATNTSTGDEDA
jgi:hypothetical protein